jgi:hypothetical protein
MVRWKRGQVTIRGVTCFSVLILALNASVGSASYFPPSESEGGWRGLDDPEAIKQVAGMDPGKLSDLEEWLKRSDDRGFAAVVIRRGYVVLEVERGNSSRTDARRVASVSKAVCATVLAIASEQSRQGKTPRKMVFEDPAFEFIRWSLVQAAGACEAVVPDVTGPGVGSASGLRAR